MSLSLSSCLIRLFNADYLEKTYESTMVKVEHGNPPITIVSASMSFKYINKSEYLSREPINVYKDSSVIPNKFVSYEFKYINELNETHSISFKTTIVGVEGNNGIMMSIFDSELETMSAGLYTNKKNGREVISADFYLSLQSKANPSISGRYHIAFE